MSTKTDFTSPRPGVLPDVASKTDQQIYTALDWVGMENIELPVRVRGMMVPARVTAQVSLDLKAARGIHMSRLYRLAQEKISEKEIDLGSLRDLLGEFLESHAGLSSSARIKIKFPFFTRRRALVSDNAGWRQYPVELMGEKSPTGLKMFVRLRITYSSTCPASAALARQANAEAFRRHYHSKEVATKDVMDWLQSESGMPATPHAQRSFAKVILQLDPSAAKPHSKWDLESWMDAIEEALKTPVQTVVKREDEQAFALQNGQNLMFCEDAARRIRQALEGLPTVLSFRGEVRHVESLHPHDAVCHFSSGAKTAR